MTLQYMVQRKEIKNIKLIQNNSQDPSLISMLIIAKQTLTNRIPISNWKKKNAAKKERKKKIEKQDMPMKQHIVKSIEKFNSNKVKDTFI